MILMFILVMKAKSCSPEQLNVRYFGRQIEGMAAKHDVTAQMKFQALYIRSQKLQSKRF